MTTFELALGAMIVLTFIVSVIMFRLSEFPRPPE